MNVKCTEIALKALLYQKGNSFCALLAVGLFNTLECCRLSVCGQSLFDMQKTLHFLLGILLSPHCSYAAGVLAGQVCLCVVLIHMTVCSYFFKFLFVCFCSCVFHLDDYIFKSGLILEALSFISPVAGCEKNT